MSFSSVDLDFRAKFWIFKDKYKTSGKESFKTNTFINDFI
jgi:hypothetical protein